jgi:hypothetical protein
MKKFLTLFKLSLHWLILFGFVIGGFINPQKARAAAGPCTVDYFHQGLITANETWCGGSVFTHYLTGDVTVQPGVTLTIAAGVTVDSVEAAWSKYLIVKGHLDINGTAEQPVLFTRSINYPIQNWSGLYFDGSQGDGSGVINHAILEHAGSNFLPAGCTGTCGSGQTAIFVKDLAAGKQVSITNSILRDNVSKGLYVVGSKVDVSNTSFSQNKFPVLIDGAASVVSYSGNTFSDNAFPFYDNVNYTILEDGIFINPGALMGHDFSLPAQTGLDAYYFMTGTTVPAGRTMTLDPGVTLRADWGAYLSILGHLTAVGTPTLPIRFTGITGSTEGVTHNWGGLYFDGEGGDGSGIIQHASIDHAGNNSLPPGCSGDCGSAQTALFVKNLPATKQVILANSIIEDSLSKGLYIINSPTVLVNNNLIKGGRVGAFLGSDLTISNLAFIDQALDGVVIPAGVTVEGRHLTIARAGQSGFHVQTGGNGLLKNSILSQNALAVWAEGSGQASLNINLLDANTSFKTGMVTEVDSFHGVAAFTADGYHILSTSDAVGRGLAGLSAVDIDGEARPSPANSRPDLGADELPVGRWWVLLPFTHR